MHEVLKLIRQVNKTHKGLGPMMAMNVLAAKAKKCILNVAPAGCGKSTVTNALARELGDRSRPYTSLTMVGLQRIEKELNQCDSHIIIDDLGAEKSNWTRVSTLSALSHLAYSHFIDRSTASGRIKIEDFTGGVSLNIQPAAMSALVQSEEWVTMVRDKVLRYYHLFRPIKESLTMPNIDISWGGIIEKVKMPSTRGRLWYSLVDISMLLWGMARTKEHITDLLRSMAVLDGRKAVNNEDMRILHKLLLPAQLEPFIIESYGFETGRVFNQNLYCILTELATFREPSIEQFCVDYKVSYATAKRLIDAEKQWVWVKSNSPSRVLPTDETKGFLEKAGVYEKW